MRVFSIQQPTNQNINHKGTVDSSVYKFINSCAKDECYKYLSGLKQNKTADKKVLMEIKNKWNKLLTPLIQKAELMHKDTVMKIDYETKKMRMHIFSENAVLSFHNTKLNLSAKYKELYSGGSYQEKKFIKYNELSDITEKLSPKQIDEKLLKLSISDIKSSSKFDTNYDEIENFTKNIIEYKAEIGNKDNLNFVEIVRNNMKSNQKNNNNISEENQKLLNEVFQQ